MQVRKPCFPGEGFNTCPQVGDGIARKASDIYYIDGLCPACSAPSLYDKHLIRMIVDINGRVRWGLGPSKRDPGCECAVM
ncbi:hypothetical protein M426DRAFT_316797 [Hypoxylon sp. CI-4A]|nr:hypothetical protein M426DRAFT_316797 [Hypoxylon sp. CI-4A]